MEDLSRELEGHIERFSKSGAVKNKNSLFFIDDFGRIKPAGWILQGVYIMGFVALFSTIAAILLFYFHTNLKMENSSLASTLNSAERRIDSLVDEKEILMARLVISGSMPSDVIELHEEKAPGDDIREPEPAYSAREIEAKIDIAGEIGPVSVPAQIIDKRDPELETIKEVEESVKLLQIIDIEDFQVKKDAAGQDLLVTFDVKKKTGRSGTIAGHVFVLLKPDPGIDTDWVVLPSVSLENEMPVLPSQGQFFSIVHFKPVRFRVRSEANPDDFKAASVLIFNDKDDKLLLKKDISILDVSG